MFRFRSGTFPSVEGRCDAGADVLGRFSGRARLDAGGVRRTVRSGRPSNAISNSKIRRGVGQTERPERYFRYAGLSGFDLIDPRWRRWQAPVDRAILKSHGRYADPGQRSNRNARVDRLASSRRPNRGPRAGDVPAGAVDRMGSAQSDRRAFHGQHRLRQHDPRGAPAALPRRSGDRAASRA